MSSTQSPKRRSKNRRTARHGCIPPAAPPYITRRIPFYEFLGEEGLTTLERQADRLIEDKGIEFRGDPEALRLWRQAGAKVEGRKVRVPADLVRSLCRQAPSEFIQHARNPARNVVIGGVHQVFTPVYGPPFVRDLEGGRRYGTINDHANLVKLTSCLSSLHHTGLVICEPCDVPVSTRHLDMVYNALVLSDKPLLGSITHLSRAQDSVNMARVVFGEEFLKRHCVIMGNVNTNSPLMVDRVVTEAARVYCGAGQGLVAVPFILSGAMGPVTTAASIAQALAEAMVVCAFTQIVRPGAPFVLGNFLSSMSLRSGAPTFGMPEPVMSNLVIGQLARRMNLPLRCGGSLTASKLPDAQAAAESADSMLSTILGGANFVMQAAGWLEGGLVSGYEKLILDADRLGMYQVLLEGMPVDDNALAWDAYAEVPPAGHFLGCGHTLRNYETAFFESAISNHESFEQWESGGAWDAAQRAFQRWKELLASYETPPMDSAVKEALDDFRARRKRELPEAWY